MHISLIDDEVILSEKITKKLSAAWYQVTVYSGYQDFLSRWSIDSDLYLIDISLQDGSGFDIIHFLRKNRSSLSPILILSGHSDSSNVVYGLEIWADDYLTKPFVPEVLLARIQALLRRAPIIKKDLQKISYKDIYFDFTQYEVFLDDEMIELTRQEKMILEIFLKNLDATVTRQQLIDAVWRESDLFELKDNAINVTLSRLKKKLGKNFQPVTLYNQGYRLES